MSVYYTTDALLLRSYDRGEADRSFVFYTEVLGRVDALGRSIRLEKSKLRGSLTLFSISRIFITSGRDQWLLLDSEGYSYDTRARSLAYAEEFSSFALKLITDIGPSEEMWRAVTLVPRLDSYERLLVLKVRTLLALGLLPSKAGLKEFFTPRAARFIAGMEDALFLRDTNELLEFNHGIERILASNHIV